MCAYRRHLTIAGEKLSHSVFFSLPPPRHPLAPSVLFYKSVWGHVCQQTVKATV